MLFFFCSWRQSSSDVAVIPAASTTRAEEGSSFKHSGTTGSHGSAHNSGGDHSPSHRQHSKDIFPEPPEAQDIEIPFPWDLKKVSSFTQCDMLEVQWQKVTKTSWFAEGCFKL